MGETIKKVQEVTNQAMQACSWVRSRVYASAYSSEMFCSLMYEDYRGCPYNTFSSSQIAFMSFALCVISAVSITLGA